MKRPTSAPRGHHALAAGISTLLLATLLPPAANATEAPPSDNGGTNGATPPTLSWEPCGNGAECTRATVPLDYDDPFGPSIELSLARVVATDPSQRIGSLFFNSGGPGGATGQLIRDAGSEIFSPALRTHFDIIGIDPRGVGESTPIRCFESAAERAEVLAAPAIPQSAEEVSAAVDAAALYGQYCNQNAGPLLGNIGTANVARDMDLVRQSLGEEQISYLGVSYGTYLGSVYANIFQHHVRALVLDGNLDAISWTTGQDDEALTTPFDTRIQSGVGAAATIDAFLAECAEAGPDLCAFAADDDPFRKWEDILERLRQGPIELPQDDGSVGLLDYSNFVGLTIQILYGPPSDWPGLATAMQGVYANVGVTTAVGQLERLALSTRQQLGYAEEQPFDDSFTSVTCSETDNPDDPQAWIDNAAEQAELFGAAGEFWAWGSLPCATWPVADNDRYSGPWDIPTPNPILLINNFFDPATSFESAVELQSQLANAFLLPVAGYGHVAFDKSACASDVVDQYLVTLELPSEGTVCTQDVIPFSEPEAPPVPVEPPGDEPPGDEPPTSAPPAPAPPVVDPPALPVPPNEPSPVIELPASDLPVPPFPPLDTITDVDIIEFDEFIPVIDSTELSVSINITIGS